MNPLFHIESSDWIPKVKSENWESVTGSQGGFLKVSPTLPCPFVCTSASVLSGSPKWIWEGAFFSPFNYQVKNGLLIVNVDI